MKAVLISIKPKWCELIAGGKKTVEVRKTRPKLETPFKCYIYRTLPKYGDWNDKDGKVIGEFVCDKTRAFQVFENGTVQDFFFEKLKYSCLSYDEIAEYIGKNRVGYSWHISNLIIYDKPKELSEFSIDCKGGCDIPYLYAPPCERCKKNKLTRPPQSWCYVEELKGAANDS